MMPTNPEKYLLLALEAANTRRGFCAPNPAVGAVIVKGDTVIATGCHVQAGDSHAEVNALQQVGDAAKGATLYVTLEPCCHVGKTPPCVDAIIAAGIQHVIYAYQDPNPMVAGLGDKQLQQAGVLVQQCSMEAIDNFYRSYTYWVEYRKPFVTAKIALSADEKIAGPEGKRCQITGPECEQLTHQLRLRADAILTTAKTILADNPQMNVRLDCEIMAKPLYVLDSKLRTPPNARIFDTAKCITFFYDQESDAEHAKSLLQHDHVCCVPIPKIEAGLNLHAVLTVIGREGVHDLWVEAGGCCFEAFYTQGLLNRAYIYTSTKTLGKDAQSAFSRDFTFMDQAEQFEWHDCGADRVAVFTASAEETSA